MKLHSLIAAALLSVAGASQAALIHQYELNGNLKDEKGGADLLAFGGVVPGPGAYAFANNNGLKLQYALGSVYTIDMGFQLAGVTNGYQRLLDFQSATADHGMYVHQDDYCFYNGSCTKYGNFVPNQPIRLTLTRDAAARVTVYQNGQSLFSFDDSTRNLANLVGSRRLSFFRDDASEVATGSVDFIHLYDNALTQHEVAALGPVDVPEPASLGLVGAGLALVGWTRRRKRSAA